MNTKVPLISKISLKGLEIAPSQVWGSIRLVPLLRQNENKNLRLFRRSYDEDIDIVSGVAFLRDDLSRNSSIMKIMEQ